MRSDLHQSFRGRHRECVTFPDEFRVLANLRTQFNIDDALHEEIEHELREMVKEKYGDKAMMETLMDTLKDSVGLVGDLFDNFRKRPSEVTTVEPLLDDWLERQPSQRLKSKRRGLRFLKEAYSVCVGDFANKPRTDVTMTDAGFRFHIGTPLRTCDKLPHGCLPRPRKRPLAKLIPALWKRHGREDLSMAGLLLANQMPAILAKTLGWHSSIFATARTVDGGPRGRRRVGAGARCSRRCMA